MMDIDHEAPLSGSKDVVIDAPVENVWTVLTTIDRWSEWQSDVSEAKLEGPLAVGSTFRWKAKGLPIVSTIQAVEPERQIGWTGKAIGMQALHLWRLIPQNGGTRVMVEESLTGWMVHLLKLFDPAFLEKSLTGSLQALKARAERPYSGEQNH